MIQMNRADCFTTCLSHMACCAALALTGLFVLPAATAAACGTTGEGCSFFKPCCNGLSCHPFIQKCFHSPRLAGEPCMAGFPCGPGLTCEAGSQVCSGPSREGEPCHLTRPCARGLTCVFLEQRCRVPGKFGEPCSAARPCGLSLACDPTSRRCRIATAPPPPPPGDCQLNAEERRIEQLMLDPVGKASAEHNAEYASLGLKQARSPFICHATLAQVARRRAQAMFDHAAAGNTGLSHCIPRSWRKDTAIAGYGRNTIESLALGFDADDGFNRWVHSQGHREHVLGQTAKDHIHYGIGAAGNGNSAAGMIYIVLTGNAEQPRTLYPDNCTDGQ